MSEMICDRCGARFTLKPGEPRRVYCLPCMRNMIVVAGTFTGPTKGSRESRERLEELKSNLRLRDSTALPAPETSRPLPDGSGRVIVRGRCAGGRFNLHGYYRPVIPASSNRHS